ncbi:MAG: nuclease-related domain-containing protein [Thermoleophilia bacterium]|nr:nuclease-related domain-containing protein [Thermoleophilia bacterium]
MRPYVIALVATSAGLLTLAVVVFRVDPWALAVVLAAGGALAMAVWLRDDVPDFIDRWRRGAEGERKTGDALEPLLARGWRVRHDVELGRGGNVDHILLSPRGRAYVVDSKLLAGDITLRRGVLVQRFGSGRSRRHEDLGERMLEQAESVALEWSRRTRRPAPPVTPVVAIWGAFAGREEARGVVYVAGGELAETLAALDGGTAATSGRASAPGSRSSPPVGASQGQSAPCSSTTTRFPRRGVGASRSMK